MALNDCDIVVIMLEGDLCPPAYSAKKYIEKSPDL